MSQKARRAVASEAQRLATLLRHHRGMAGLTQQQLARRVGYSRSSVANAETGDVRALDFYRRCDATLGAAGAIEAARSALGPAAVAVKSARSALGGPPPHAGQTAGGAQSASALRTAAGAQTAGGAQTADGARTADGVQDADGAQTADGAEAADGAQAAEAQTASWMGLGALLGPVPPEEVIEHLRRHWHLLVRTDNLLGPHAALPTTIDHLVTLAALLPGTAGPVRTAVLCLSARYAETASWLHQDAGQPGNAAMWAGRALEWAHESDDRATLAWALHRHSRLRAAKGDVAGALALARAALRSLPDAHPPSGWVPLGTRSQAPLATRGRAPLAAHRSPLAAALRVQYARASAAAGDRLRCEQLLRQAAVIADVRETAGDGHTGYGGHCTRAWVLAARGECALTLGSPEDAVSPLRTSLALLAPAYRRNRGLAAGWLAEAYLRLGAVDEASRAATECREIGEATRSASVLTQAHTVDELRRPFARPGERPGERPGGRTGSAA